MRSRLQAEKFFCEERSFMFTGLIQRKGTVKRVSRGAGSVVEILADEPWERPLEKGESVAVDGVCLTVASCSGSRFTADVLKETESRSGIGDLLPGAKVNLERALRAGESMGGHIVQGHVDCRGEIEAKTPKGRDFTLRIKCGRVFASQSVLKGSVTIDGTSLTITELGEDYLCVDLIPVTVRDTTLGGKRPGDKVNLESDVIGKYVTSSVATCRDQAPSSSGLTEEALSAAGFL
jgi:riboflavin synthase